MDVQVITTSSELLRETRRLGAWASKIDLVSAWASTAAGTANHWTALPTAKITRALLGTQFAQTEPWVIRELDARGVLRLRYDLGSTFHPKLIVATKGKQVRAILGSSNFTLGGFGRNTEINLLLSGQSSEDALARLMSFVDDQWEHDDSFEVPDAAWLAAYEAKWRSRIHTPALPTPLGIRPHLADLEDMSWSEYYALIEAQHGRPLRSGPLLVFGSADSYFYEMRGASEAFARHRRFADMPLEDRVFAMGLGESTGYFGRMAGAGMARSIVMNEPHRVGEHLDRIPNGEEVGADLLLSVTEGLCSMQRFSLGVASRLLVAKRPDLFLPLNKANKVAVRKLAGSAPSNPRSYVALHRKLWATPWFQSDEPSGKKQRTVWRGRVGLLDAVLYDGRGS